jgi:uroporphyrinogen-III synthase
MLDDLFRSRMTGNRLCSPCLMVNVLLLRQPSEDVADSYEDHFCNAGYHPFSLPALETSHVNLTILSDIVRDGLKANGFNGVIITSQRSCEALGNAFNC